MYEAFYELKEKPFGIVPNPEYLYFSERHQGALTYLEYGLMDNVGIILLTGVVGIGKTTLIRHVINNYCENIVTAVIYNTNLSPDQLIETILQTLDLSFEKNNKSKNTETLNQFLLEQAEDNKRVLFIIDEAQNLSYESLEEVRMLSNLQTDDRLLLQIMLVGQPELRARIQSPELSQFAQRIAVNYHLEALDHKETMAYIQHRLETAGRDANLFTESALNQICQSAMGIPRSVNLICDAALVYGFGYELAQIGSEVIDQVLADKNNIGLECIDNCNPPKNPNNGNGAGDPNTADKLKKLEFKIEHFQSTVQGQVELLAKQIREVKRGLTTSLTQLYRVERKRNEELIIHTQKLTHQYNELKKKHRAAKSKNN